MNVLIVDDQYTKVEVFARCLREAGIENIKHVPSAFEALQCCKNTLYDLMILDIQLPNRIGESVDRRGGVSLLEQLELNNRLFTPIHIVVATSYEESYVEFKEYFDKKGWKIIKDSNDEESIKEIINAIDKHCVTKASFDVAILTALPHIEQEAVFKLPIEWKDKFEFDDPNRYYEGCFTNSNGDSKTVITTCCPRMGIAASASVAMKMLLKFKPKVFLMTGIAAGVKGKCNIGDILIADPCWDWGSGKMTAVDGKPKFLCSPHQIGLSTTLRTSLKEYAVAKTYLKEIYQNWDASRGNKPEHELAVHVGPVATGAVVIEDPDTLNLVTSQNRDTVGVEMEAYGLLAASIYSYSSQQTETLVIKSVCDFADLEKNDNWQPYAAYTSTEFAFRFLKDYLV